MEPWYMESVWWVFQTLFQKNLVYRGYKVMPYSMACGTPLSNFEANLEYNDVVDPAVTVTFPLLDPLPGEEGALFLAWTTTPWTLPSNLALCVNPSMSYVRIKDTASGQVYILARPRLCSLYKNPEDDEKSGAFIVLAEFEGRTLVGRKYEALFPYYVESFKNTAFRVVMDEYVTSDSGTGIVHQAPAFGEDDFRVCQATGILLKGQNPPCPVDTNGRFEDPVAEYKGLNVKDADKGILKHLKAIGRLLRHETFKHSYPFCWRSHTPLIYKAVPSWFVKVEEIKDRLVANNLKSTWVPSFVSEKRFHNWLESARDWCISRGRFWGTPLPIWHSDDWEEIVVIGSIKELQDLTGRSDITDIHRQFIDDLTIPSKCGKGKLHRVDEVFDCWFESGAMPYAQVHYPFENKERFENGFPADFIAEGLDQTRGWFYTLMVLSTALFDKPAFRNCVVNGLVLAEDGKKMSKSLRNYPDPTKIVHLYGADALRLYLINSPVVRAERLLFKEKGVAGVLKDVMLPWHNAYRFLVMSILAFESRTGSKFVADSSRVLASTNIMDKWILAASNSLIKHVRTEMDQYHLYSVVRGLLQFIEQLTNWYIRFNRRRLKAEDCSDDDSHTALCTLFDAVLTLCRLMAPFTPFITEFQFQNLKRCLAQDQQEDSVHYTLLPSENVKALDDHIERSMGYMQTAIELGRSARERRNIGLKTPLRSVLLVHPSQSVLDDIKSLEGYVIEQLNVRGVEYTTDEQKYVELKAQPEFALLGERLGNDMKAVAKEVAALTNSQIQSFEKSGSIALAGYSFVRGEIKLLRSYKGDTKKFEASNKDEMLLVLDVEPDVSLLEEGVARDIVSRIQKMRKAAQLSPEDDVEMFYNITSVVAPVPSAVVVSASLAADQSGSKGKKKNSVAVQQPKHDENQVHLTLCDVAKVVSGKADFIKSLTKKFLLPTILKPDGTVTIIKESHEIEGATVELDLVRPCFYFDDSVSPKVATLVNRLNFISTRSKAEANGGVFEFVLDGEKNVLRLGKELLTQEQQWQLKSTQAK
eukprot:c9418_g1_i3.p1 GENE.c9418_g1_i3~~c9418_g1_i3.p1  ORF type:complete len:1211 (+),score=221.13 c9418_g1_i3:517-3633(+)